MATQKKYVSLDKLTKYDELLKAKMAIDDAAALTSAKDYADGLADNYDVAGAAATAESNAKNYTDVEVGKAKTAAENLVGTIPTDEEGNKVADNAVAYAEYLQEQEEARVNELLNGKVDKVTGKGLSTNDLTDALKQNYDNAYAHSQTPHAPADAERNIITSVKVNGSAIAVDNNRAVDIAVPTDNSQLANGAGYLVAADIANKADKATTLEGYGITDAYTDEEVDKKFEDFIAAYITADGGTIDKLNEIASWIADDKAGAAKLVADVEANTQKLNGIESGAQVNDIETVKVNGTALTIANKAVDITVPTGALANKSAVSESDLDTALATKLNGMTDANELAGAISAERALIDVELAKKVDKVNGKGLSTNDLTDALKDNYDTAYTHSQTPHAPANAQANIIESVKVNGTALTITSKAVDITVPTDNASLTNGAGYLVASDIANKADKATTLAGYGIADAYTTTQTDTAIATAMSQFVEVSEAEINALFA